VSLLENRVFWYGVIVGVVAPIVYHKYVKAIPGGKAA
jgi:hypothetical protein